MKSTLNLLLALLALAPLRLHAADIGRPFALAAALHPGERYMHIRYLGALELSGESIEGYAPHGLSGLAWDADEGLLYAVSDRGYLLHLRPVFAHGRLAGLDFLAAHALRDPQGKPLSGAYADAEGLALRRGANGRRGDSQLFVSFEVHPRIVAYRPDGRYLHSQRLPPQLTDISAYRGRNAALESCTFAPGYGILTAPQLPLRSAPRTGATIYAMDGRRWHFDRLDARDSAIVDLAPAGRGAVLVLERRYRSVFEPLIFNLRLVRLGLADRQGRAPVEELAQFDNFHGWRLDNFEGLALHRDRRYFMISDDNGSALQRTLLVYFEIEPAAGSPPASP